MKSASIALASLAVASAVQVEERRDPLMTWSATPKKSAYPVDYAVPKFGEDHDIIETKKSWATQEAAHGHFWNVNAPKPDDPPRDYFVPSFGKDSDMSGTMNSLSIAEDQRKHKLIMGTPESRAKYANKAKDTQYNYYPKLDADVKVS